MAYLRDSKGFTLIEVFVVLLIFICGIVPLLKLQISTIDGNLAANQLTEATNFAESKMEQLLGWNCDDINSAALSSRTIGDYNVSWSRNQDSPVTDTTTITVNVCWIDKDNKSHCVSMSSIKGR
jgi:Tfp pilus assembly protein PilV